jgi:P27 family predicted phage terminase small subunit
VTLPKGELAEPIWSQTFVAGSDDDVTARLVEVASTEWRRVVPVLTVSAGVADVDLNVLHDYCVCVARIDQCERALSRDGLMLLGERGWQKNGHTTIVGQYRQQLRSYVVELGLSPSARVKLPPAGDDDDEDSVFD